jgi:TetR/AcrR family transcriptional repressor of nem operon
MARPKAFDQEDVLDKAVAVFWAKGYEATSMQDLVDAMGIQRGSLYATFGTTTFPYRSSDCKKSCCLLPKVA